MLRVFKLCGQGWARGGWRCLVAAAPFVAFAVSAALVLTGSEGLPGLPRPALGHIMRLEGYAFATGFFFMWFLTVGGIAASSRVPVPVVMFSILAAIVALMTWLLWSTRPGIMMVFQYWALVVISYGGALLDRGGPAAFLPWLQRTVWMIVCYFVTLMCIDAPVNVDSWSTQDSVMRVVVVYFSLLAFMELTGLYHVEWKRPAEGATAADPAPSPNPEREKFAARLRAFGSRREQRPRR